MNLYVHYKGGLYIRLDTAFDATNDTSYTRADPLVVYQAMTHPRLDEYVSSNMMWTRRLSEFHEEVKWPDGVMRSRFELAITLEKIVKLYQAAASKISLPHKLANKSANDTKPRTEIEELLRRAQGLFAQWTGGYAGVVAPLLADIHTALNSPAVQGAYAILRERQRQVISEDYTADHDDEHHHGMLAIVAAELAVEGTDASVSHPDRIDPWGLVAKHTDPIRRLEIAGALIAAEIDRMKRAGSSATTSV